MFFVEGFFIASFLYRVYNRKALESVLEVRLKAFVINYNNECESANTLVFEQVRYKVAIVTLGELHALITNLNTIIPYQNDVNVSCITHY